MDAAKFKKDEDALSHGIWTITRVLGAIPLVWCVCFSAFLLSAINELGYVPTYANPDPKTLTSGGVFYALSMLLLIPASIASVAWPVTLLLMGPLRREFRQMRGWLAWTVLSVAGIAYFWLIMAGPLGEWLLD